MKLFTLALQALVTLALTQSVFSQNLIFNGDLQNWSDLRGEPPLGIPTGWGGEEIVQGPGLSDAETYSAILPGGKMFYQVLSSKSEYPSSFQVRQTIAVVESAGWQQPLSIVLQETGADGGIEGRHDWIKLRIAGAKGVFSIQAHDGSAGSPWQTIAENVITPSTYLPSSNTFETKNAFVIEIRYQASSKTYSVSYGEASGSLTTISDLAYFFEPSNGSQRLAFVAYAGVGDTSQYQAVVGAISVVAD